MLQKVEQEKQDSTKLKLYEKYFKQLSSNNETLILKFKNKALEPKANGKKSEKRYAGILCVIGVAYKNIKEYDSCEKYQLAGLKIYQKINDKKGISMAYNGLGVLEKNRNNFIKSLEYYFKALEPLDKEKDRKNGAD